jgi:ATP adenylyltransferase
MLSRKVNNRATIRKSSQEISNMKKIWAPWRMQYILQSGKEEGCFLCAKPAESKTRDKSNYLLYRGKLNYVILNAYPYTPGHLMVVPYRHIANLIDATASEAKEHVHLLQMCIRLLTSEVSPAGFNLGMNLGKVAGAGVEGHIHTHVVPRWNGDHNYMSVVANTRVLSEGLADTYAKLNKGLKSTG